MPDIALRVNGKEYAGWKSARVTRGIESVAGGFDLSVSERWNGQSAPWPIQEEDRCTLLIGSAVVLTGYVDLREPSYGPGEHGLRVTGRDKTGLLVDCSAVLDVWEFADIPLLDLAKRLCEPFGISVSIDSSLSAAVTLLQSSKGASVSGAGGSGKLGGLGLPKPPKKFSVDPGESAFEILDRACRLAGVLPVSDGQGGLRLTRAGTSRASTELVEGQNILQARASFDAATRYRTYTVWAQHQGSDDWSGDSVAAVKGTATDPNVRRASRVLLIRPESSATPESAQTRAAWEAKVRAARADSVTVTVQGWTQGNGALWPINALIRVRSPKLGINGSLLITQAVYSVDDSSGTTTQLTLKRPDAYTPEPIVSNDSVWKEISAGV